MRVSPYNYAEARAAIAAAAAAGERRAQILAAQDNEHETTWHEGT